jgi:hypothetical protein
MACQNPSLSSFSLSFVRTVGKKESDKDKEERSKAQVGNSKHQKSKRQRNLNLSAIIWDLSVWPLQFHRDKTGRENHKTPNAKFRPRKSTAHIWNLSVWRLEFCDSEFCSTRSQAP